MKPSPKQTHTPGPWKLKGEVPINIRDGKMIEISKNGAPIAYVEGYWEHEAEDKANARLIAAAPELLETLISLRHKEKLLPSDRETIRQAIAKAKGTQ